jgi:Ca2+-binding EF-hand superfamily protein
MQVFIEIVDTIKKKNISPLQSFQMFDQNNDGKISKHEFSAVINSMQIKLSPEDIEILFLFIDLDG